MAQVITTKSSTPAKNTTTRRTYGKKENSKPSAPLFHGINYILMIIGAVILVIGYITLSGGAAEDPSQFSEAIFDTRRLYVAPILMLLGLVIEIFAIMWHPMSKKKNAEATNTPQESPTE